MAKISLPPRNKENVEVSYLQSCRAVTKEVALPAGARTSEGMSKGGVDRLDGVAAIPKGRSIL